MNNCKNGIESTLYTLIDMGRTDIYDNNIRLSEKACCDLADKMNQGESYYRFLAISTNNLSQLIQS